MFCVCVCVGGEGVQICEGGSKSASGYGPGGSKSASGFGPGGPNPRGVQIRCDTGITIGAVVGSITKALKATGKAIGNGLKDIGAKIGSLLPGLIGSVVSFLFKTAGQAIGFLAEHTWLLILAAVVFIFEKYIKKRR